MRRAVVDDDVVRLVRAAQRMARLAQDIGERAQRDDAPGGRAVAPGDALPSSPPADRLVQAARDAMAAHRRQPDFGAPAMFRSQAWLLMLDLFVAGRTGQAVPVKAASLTLGSAASTANRTILDLERLGLVASLSDDKDARRRLLRLTPTADAVVTAYLGQLIERREPSLRLSMKLAAEPNGEAGHGAGSEPVLVATPIHPAMDRSVSGIETVLQ